MNHSVKKTYSISELSEEFGITPRTIRYYEDENLITPKRQGNSRIYSASDRTRLIWILRGKRVGFSITEIREILDMQYIDGGKLEQCRRTILACKDRMTILTQKKKDIDETLKELHQLTQTVTAFMEENYPNELEN